MKTFQQFQEEMNKKVPPVTGLGGGGGGTDAIMATAKGKSLKKRIKDVGKLATVPFRAVLGIKSKPDPTEKFASEEVNKKMPPVKLGGGGGGTNSITDKAPYKSLKKKAIDAVKISTIPARFLLNIKSKPDPTEKFADSYKTPKEKVSSAIRDYKKQKKVNEGVASLAVKGGSKLIPLLMTGIGTAGTIMQIKNPKRSVYTGTRKSQKKERIPTQANKKTVEVAKDLGLDLTDPRQRRKAQSRAIARGLKKQNKTNKKINPETGDVIKPRYNTKLKGIQIHPKKGEAEATEKLIDKINNPSYLEKVRRNVRKEEAMAAPTNSMGGGAIAGSVEAGDNPPVNKKKKKGEPTIIARGCMPGARTRFKTGADLFTRIKKNKYT
jgi:hypothetical protein